MSQPTLFAAAGQGDSYTRLVSTNGGQSWQTLPTAGLPAGAQLFNITQRALSDGSVLMGAQDSATGSVFLYAWKPGSASWHQIAQPFSPYLSSLSVSSAGGHDTLWVVINTSKTHYSVMSYTLA